MKTILSVLLIFIVTGCATIDSLSPGMGRRIRVDGTSYAKVWRAANKVVSQQLAIVSSEQNLGVIKAEKGAGLTTWGEVVGVFITPAREGAKSYEIEVVSQKRSKLQLTGQNWEETIVSGIKAEL